MLPTGPEWRCKSWATACPTKRPLHLFYRDPLECIQSILFNPLVKDSIEFTPFRLYESATKAMRLYTEWLSGDVAWSMQVCVFHNLFTNNQLLMIVDPAAPWCNFTWSCIII